LRWRARPEGLAGHEGARRRSVDGGRHDAQAAVHTGWRGYGFVTREAEDGDIFVHAAVLRRHGMESLTPGQKVMVRIAEGQKGLQVVDIRAA
jgi:cold shock CspA family protein